MSSPAPLTLELPIVDTHAHAFREGMPLAPDAWMKPGIPRPVEEFLSVLDAHHVPFGVLAANSLYGTYNDYTLEALSRHPRLRATAIVPPTVEVAELRRLKAAGVVGIRLVWAFLKELPDLRSEPYRTFLRALADLDLHVELLLGGERAAPVIAALQAASVKLVIDHFGFPDPALGLACPAFAAASRAAANERTWVKLAAFHRLDGAARPYADALLAAAGPERLVWGSDWPFLASPRPYTYDEAVAGLLECVPDPGTRRLMSETALRLYGWS